MNFYFFLLLKRGGKQCFFISSVPPEMKKRSFVKNMEKFVPQEISQNYLGKISSIVEYYKLKIKEGFGDLSESDFQKVLDYEFDSFSKNIDFLETFDPKNELDRIRNIPKNERKDFIEKYKVKLRQQRIGLAKCRRFIERSIEFNNEIPRDDLDSIFTKFKDKFGFCGNQEEIIKSLLDNFYLQRQIVIEAREKWSDNLELIRNLTQVDFNKSDLKSLDVSVGPMSIDIKTNGFNCGRIYEHAEEPSVKFKYGGFAAQSSHEVPIYYTVIKNDLLFRMLYDAPGVVTHEHEHEKNKLFEHIFFKKISEQEEQGLWVEYEEEEDIELKKIKLENYIIPQIEYALNRAKDEITAFLTERSPLVLQSDLANFFFKDGYGGAYDYLQFLRDFEPKKDDELYQNTLRELFENKYKKIISNAVESFRLFRKKRKMDSQELIALLTDKSLAEWPKTINRLLEE